MQQFSLGALDLSPVYPGKTAQDAVWETLELAPRVEEFGYSRYWLAEHHGPRIAHSSPELLLPVVAGLTQRMRIGTAGVLLLFYSPLKVAKNFRLLHSIYPDRVDLGLARGMLNPETTTLLRDGATDPVDYQTKVSDLVGYLRGNSKIVVNPHNAFPPEVWMLGSNTTSLELAANHGTAFCFAGFLNKSQDLPELMARYRADFKPSIEMRAPKCAIALAGVCAATDAAAQALLPADIPYQVHPTMVGSQDTCRRQLEKLRCETEVTEFIFLDMCRAFEDRVDSYRRLAEAVL